MMAITHIVVFEPEANGDQMDLVRHLVNAVETYIGKARITLLTSRDAADHPKTTRLLADFPDIDLRLAPEVAEGHRLFRRLNAFYERQWKNAQALSRGLADIKPETVDFVFFPYLETIGLLHLALDRSVFRGRRWATIAHNIRFHHRSAGIKGPVHTIDMLQRLFFWRVIGDPRLVCLGTNNPYLPAAARHPKVVYCPATAVEPALSDRNEARSYYGIRPETCVVLVFGFIDRRKCVDILLQAAARVITDLDLTILVAGAQNPADLDPVMRSDAARTLRDHGKLIEVNRFIDDSKDIDPMNAADIVWVFYEKAFVRNSDVLARSAMARRPVIARQQGLIGRLVEDHELGLAPSSDSPADVAAALTALARDPLLRRQMGENGRRAFVKNTPDALMRPIVEAFLRSSRHPV
jgi:glycosyltransferase involved in cell wall biosynthesis